MRSIKFRIRNKNNGQWWYFDLWDEDMGKINQDNLDKTTIGQFTGLLDKQGKEIYEGDILQINAESNIQLKNHNYTAIIKWEECNSRFVADDNGGSWHCSRWYKDEVIGNIYENSDLLN